MTFDLLSIVGAFPSRKIDMGRKALRLKPPGVSLKQCRSCIPQGVEIC